MFDRLFRNAVLQVWLAASAGALPPHFLKTDGASITDQAGEIVPLRGVNTAWIHLRGGGIPDPRIDSILANRFGIETKNRIIDAYLDNWITTDDLDAIAELGMNVIRVPFSYKTFFEIGATGGQPDGDGYTYTVEKRDAEAFRKLDWIVNEAAARGIYCMLDFHNFQGGVGDPANPLSMLANATSQTNARRILQRVATRYLGNPWVAGYDLVNEPYGIPTTIYRDFHNTIRAIDPDHIIFIQSWSWDRFPNVTSNGLSGVSCSLHFYPNLPNGISPTWEQRLEQVDAITREFRDNRSAGPASGRFVPIQIGEFNMSGDRVIEAFEDHGATWTMWSWKDRNHGNQAINNIFSYLPQSKIDQINALDIWNDTPEEIIAAFQAMRSPAPFTQFRVQGRDQMASPVPLDDVITAPISGARTITAADLVANDRHLGAAAVLHPVELSDPAHGTITARGNGWIYTPDPGFSGEDSFTYRAYDLHHRMVSGRKAAVTVQVAGSPGPGVTVDPPAAPSGLSAVALSGSVVELGWTDASDNESHFVIERRAPGSPHFRYVAMVPAGTTSWQDGRLSSSTTYRYQVRATNAGGDSAPAAAVDVTLKSELLDPVFSAPSGVTATVRSNSVALAWSSHAANESGFMIERKTGTAGVWAVVATTAKDASSWVDSAVLPATRYFYRLHAFNDSNRTVDSPEAVADTPGSAIWTGPEAGLWSAAGHWQGSPPVAAGNSNLIFNLTDNRATVNDLAGLTVFSIAWPAGTGANTISGNRFTVAGPLSVGATQAQRIESPLGLSGPQVVDVATNGILTLSGDIQDGTSPGAITKTGGGTLVLGGSNSFSGSAGNRVLFSGGNSGRVVLAHPSALPTGAVVRFSGGGSGNLELLTDSPASAIAFASGTGNGGMLTANRATAGPGLVHSLGVLDLSSVTLTVNKGGNVTSGNSRVSFSELRMTGGNDNQPVTLAGDADITIGSAAITNNGFPKRLRLDGTSPNNQVGGVIADGIAGAKVQLIKSNVGTWHLRGNNTYSGDTTVSAGTLRLDFPCLHDGAAVRVDGVLELAHGGIDRVGSLQLAGVVMPAGVHNASNSGGRITGNGSLRVGPVSDFEHWAQAAITAREPAADATADGDPDGDGEVNLAEFAFRGDPLDGSARGLRRATTANELVLTLAVRRAGGAPFTGSPLRLAVHGVTYFIEGGADLAGFGGTVVEVPPQTEGLPDLVTDPDYEYRSFRLAASVGLPGRGFLRARVEP
jgi:autotransporter-associated beta strand protein